MDLNVISAIIYALIKPIAYLTATRISMLLKAVKSMAQRIRGNGGGIKRRFGSVGSGFFISWQIRHSAITY